MGDLQRGRFISPLGRVSYAVAVSLGCLEKNTQPLSSVPWLAGVHRHHENRGHQTSPSAGFQEFLTPSSLLSVTSRKLDLREDLDFEGRIQTRNTESV